MKYLLVIVFIGLAFCTTAQQEIKLEEVRNHIGDSVKLRAKIYGGKYLETSANTPTFLDVGGHYPKAPLTLLIWGDARKQFTNAPETFYTGKEQWLTGRLELYKNKPEIIIYNQGQITDIRGVPAGK
jgi:hypothetical protein